MYLILDQFKQKAFFVLLPIVLLVTTTIILSPIIGSMISIVLLCLLEISQIVGFDEFPLSVKVNSEYPFDITVCCLRR